MLIVVSDLDSHTIYFNLILADICAAATHLTQITYEYILINT